MDEVSFTELLAWLTVLMGFLFSRLMVSGPPDFIGKLHSRFGDTFLLGRGQVFGGVTLNLCDGTFFGIYFIEESAGTAN